MQAIGRYCSTCGEKFMSDADFDVKHFHVHHVPHEVVHWDGKLGLTLRELILAPCKMAAHYVRGRRQPYQNPLRLYPAMFVVQAFLSGIGAPIIWAAARAISDLPSSGDYGAPAKIAARGAS